MGARSNAEGPVLRRLSWRSRPLERGTTDPTGEKLGLTD